MKPISSLCLAASLFVLSAFTSGGETRFSKWEFHSGVSGVQPKDTAGIRTYTFTEDEFLNKITVYYNHSDILSLSESEKYTGDQAVARELRVRSSSTKKIVYSLPLKNTEINVCRIIMDDIYKAFPVKEQGETFILQEIIQINGKEKANRICSFGLN